MILLQKLKSFNLGKLEHYQNLNKKLNLLKNSLFPSLTKNVFSAIKIVPQGLHIKKRLLELKNLPFKIMKKDYH